MFSWLPSFELLAFHCIIRLIQYFNIRICSLCPPSHVSCLQYYKRISCSLVKKMISFINRTFGVVLTFMCPFHFSLFNTIVLSWLIYSVLSSEYLPIWNRVPNKQRLIFDSWNVDYEFTELWLVSIIRID
jgi:hypothetical protein